LKIGSRLIPSGKSTIKLIEFNLSIKIVIVKDRIFSGLIKKRKILETYMRFKLGNLVKKDGNSSNKELWSALLEMFYIFIGIINQQAKKNKMEIMEREKITNQSIVSNLKNLELFRGDYFEPNYICFFIS